ncbi:hypothetical protein M409DRAFT_23610 [Zasmidium cellare ATCC 36951]|uniref:NAD(P)-binding domain-containing protein n=1 Tax=Zasmidium cellare ATCC 36951 TaxID=1080233 RepID=A0A6A6CJJ4_ZASCE|nr:uncharacterized protein M409DRAFT_23610 [Zasmidium cellare ATCC 36951]KAF2165879.1 hypothetical protein M409DRAFT_23610 [Zasmidium cellare ATCC 36951]
MAHIILTGATGTAGAGILAHALTVPTIAKISILSRRPVKLAENQPEATVILHKDFTTYPPDVLSQLSGATACIWAQGISSRGMSEEEYTKITHDYPVAAARAFAGLGENFTFVYTSGEGAEMDKEGGMLYAKVKGKAERSLLNLQAELPSLHVFNIRPAGINPAGNYLAERKPSWVDRGINLLGNVFERVYKPLVISTENLGKACVRLAMNDGKPWPEGKGVEEQGRLIRNVALRRIAEEAK